MKSNSQNVTEALKMVCLWTQLGLQIRRLSVRYMEGLCT